MRLQLLSAVSILGRSAGGEPNFLIRKVQLALLPTSVGNIKIIQFMPPIKF
jgi:hypothetical protein